MQAAGYVEDQAGAQAEIQAIPVYGSIAAGSPIEAEENFSGYIRLEYAQKHFGADCFALKVVGDSMDLANMPDGSTVIVKRQSEVRDGEIGAVMIAGQATVKRIYHQGNIWCWHLVSKSALYGPQVYSGEDEVRILGKVVLALVDII